MENSGSSENSQAEGSCEVGRTLSQEARARDATVKPRLGFWSRGDRGCGEGMNGNDLLCAGCCAGPFVLVYCAIYFLPYPFYT